MQMLTDSVTGEATAVLLSTAIAGRRRCLCTTKPPAFLLLPQSRHIREPRVERITAILVEVDIWRLKLLLEARHTLDTASQCTRATLLLLKAIRLYGGSKLLTLFPLRLACASALPDRSTPPSNRIAAVAQGSEVAEHSQSPRAATVVGVQYESHTESRSTHQHSDHLNIALHQQSCRISHSKGAWSTKHLSHSFTH